MDHVAKVFWEMMGAVIVVIIVMTICCVVITCVRGAYVFIFQLFDLIG